MQAEAAAGKPALPGLPAFRDGDGVETLTLTLRDVFGLEVQLRYTVYEAEDLITRTAVYTNTSSLPLTLHKAASLCLDFAPGPMDLITLNGTWAAERTPERAPLRWGIQSIGSTRGIPGHAHNPAAILCTPDCTETAGSCWGFALVYSGNFLIEAQRADAGQRLVMGIHPYHFHWQLEPGASFAAPEAAMVYSDQGLGEMSRRFHNAIRTRLLPPRWQDMKAPRPVLLNSWEACYFDFDEAKLLALAGAARQADIDLFVLDDGWFKGRNGTTSSLGDWTADRAKLPDGLPGLCAKLNAMDLGLGLWVEPEAVSPNSDLYRAHPDWAFAVPGRQPCQIRCQYNLDLSRPEVVDGVWQQLEQVLRSCPIQYLKWDMNRALADVYSPALPAARQGEVYHRYVLGLYELQRRVTETFPDLLLENCAGGGAYLWHLAADVEPDYTVTVVSRLSPEEALLDAVEEKLTALAADEPNAGLVVLADCGEADNIHPVDKEPAGRRLALLALETVYGQPVAGRSPQLLEARRGPGPGQVLLRFAHHAGGMQVRGGGVQLAGADGVFRDAQAAPAGPDRILACCGALRDPCAVRYAWYNYGPAGLYGGTGLPAAPFGPRTLND